VETLAKNQPQTSPATSPVGHAPQIRARSAHSDAELSAHIHLHTQTYKQARKHTSKQGKHAHKYTRAFVITRMHAHKHISLTHAYTRKYAYKHLSNTCSYGQPQVSPDKKMLVFKTRIKLTPSYACRCGKDTAKRVGEWMGLMPYQL